MRYWTIVKETKFNVLSLEGPYESKGDAQLMCDAYNAVETDPNVSFKPMPVLRPFYQADCKGVSHA